MIALTISHARLVAEPLAIAIGITNLNPGAPILPIALVTPVETKEGERWGIVWKGEFVTRYHPIPNTTAPVADMTMDACSYETYADAIGAAVRMAILVMERNSPDLTPE